MTILGSLAAIELLSPGMLGWLAAAGIPLAINLWIRSRAQETPWAAMELLLQAVRNESRRIRLHNWLLLAIRTAALALVAAAVTRPLWRGAGSGALGTNATHHVLVLDCSASMAARGVENGSRWDEAQTAAAEIVRSAARGDAFTVFGWGATVRDPLGRPVQEPDAALAALAQLEQESTRGEVADAIATAGRAIDRGRKDFPQASAVEVHWLTDRAATTWGEIANAPDAGSAATRWKELTQLATQSFPLGDSPRRPNAAISRVRVDPASVIAGQEAAVVADVACTGAIPSELTAELSREGRRIAVQPVVAPATGATCQVRFPVPDMAAGEHAWEVRLAEVAANGDEVRGSSDDLVATTSDALPADDVRWLVADVPRQIQAGLVVDSPHAADDLSRALTASAGATAAIGVETVPQVQLSQRSVDQFAVLAVCNVAEYSQRDADALRQFASDGGGLLWVLGSRVDVANFRQRFGPQAADEPSLAPCKVERDSHAGAWHIDPLGYRDAILEPFAANRRAGLLTATIARRYRLAPWDDAAPATAMHVVAACDDGVPLLVTSRFGAGRVAVLGTDVALRPRNAGGGRGEPWSTLPVSPSFVPLMRRLVDDLTAGRNGANRNCLAGEPLVGSIADAGEFRWQTPRGEQRPVQRATQKPEPGWRPSASFSDTTIAGLYTLAATSTTQFAVNVDPRESDLTAIPAAELLAAGRSALDAPIASGSPVTGDMRGTAATALATRLLIAALGCLVIERLLVARAARSYA